MLNERLPKEFGFVNEPIKASGIKKLITAAIKKYTSEEVRKLSIVLNRLDSMAQPFREFQFRFLIIKWFLRKMD